MTGQDAVAFLAFVGVVGFATRPLVTAVARRISRDPDAALPPEAVDDLRAELDDARGRLAAVEERLDFAERMLAKQREPERVGAPPRS